MSDVKPSKSVQEKKSKGSAKTKVTGSARLAALSALSKSRRGGDFAADALDAACAQNALDARDIALVTALYYSAVQNLYYIDYYIDHYLSIPIKKLQPKVLDILRISACQILFMDKIPASAAVNEGVELCKSLGMAKAAGLTNAVLRRISENKNNLPKLEGESAEKIMSTRYSIPLWLVERVISRVGEKAAAEFFRFCNEEPRLSVQVNTLKAQGEEVLTSLLSAGVSAERHPFLADCLLLDISGKAMTELPQFLDGQFYVQDAASKLAALATGASEGDKILDVCSAPGGKSFAISIQTGDRSKVLSCDISEGKLQKVMDGAARLGISGIKTRKADGRELVAEWKGAFDVVLCDVPCSGFGVIAKKPEIRYKAQEDISRLPQIQLDIIKNASNYVNKNGVLLYSTCTILEEENEDVVRAFLAENDDFELENFEPCAGIRSEGGMLTLWPQQHATDGFFAAKLRKKCK